MSTFASHARPVDHPIVCLGEALVDLVYPPGQDTPESAHVGGSPFNVACLIARQGYPTAMGTWFGPDDHGAAIVEVARAHNLTFLPGSDGAAATSVAHAHLDETRQATYTFDLEWTLPGLPAADTISHIHIGSIGATLAPGCQAVAQAVADLHAAGCGTVSYDPNIRPTLMGQPEDVRDQIEFLISHSDVVKASDEDCAWLYPGQDIDTVLRRWLDMGPRLAVVTRGGQGARVAVAGETEMHDVAATSTTVVDTVGAGDSFMGGLVTGLLDAGLLGGATQKAALARATWEDVQPAVAMAARTSGITVSHAGAYAPRREEL